MNPKNRHLFVPAARIKSGVLIITALFLGFGFSATAQTKMAFTVSMDNPGNHRFHVVLHEEGAPGEVLEFKLPAWTPGFYMLLNFADNVENFKAMDGNNKPLTWEKGERNVWKVKTNHAASVVLTYDVKAMRPFVATSYLDEEHGYIMPASLFMHLTGKIMQPSTLTVVPYTGWKNVVTGLDSIRGKHFTYTAQDFDALYDSPILIGNLESLSSFTVGGIPHYFSGYKLGDFDRNQLVEDLKKIVTAATGIFADIPYKHYTFIAIGPGGGGGIEHLNSTSFSFDGSSLNTREGRIRMLSFLAHEYFHHFNVKRIRPIELGPFDYDHENRTNQLWISEGISVYYEYVLLRRAGIISQEELLNLFRNNMLAYETKPGRHFQSLAKSSYETWSDNPFGQSPEQASKTISYYDKGPVVGMLLDFAIRYETQNKKSLDDVMRILYNEYYKKQNRGFTEKEFRAACTKVAGKDLPEIFDYIYSVKELNYPKYLGYAGLAIDTTSHELPEAYSGITTRQRRDTLFVSAVAWGSPAMKAGVQARDAILEVDGTRATPESFNEKSGTKKPGDKMNIVLWHQHTKETKEIMLGKKIDRSFNMRPLSAPDALQTEILKDW